MGSVFRHQVQQELVVPTRATPTLRPRQVSRRGSGIVSTPRVLESGRKGPRGKNREMPLPTRTSRVCMTIGRRGCVGT
jgi:hypothetical protein